MAQYWRNFAYSGDPNIPPPWQEPHRNETLPVKFEQGTYWSVWICLLNSVIIFE